MVFARKMFIEDFYNVFSNIEKWQDITYCLTYLCVQYFSIKKTVNISRIQQQHTYMHVNESYQRFFAKEDQSQKIKRKYGNVKVPTILRSSVCLVFIHFTIFLMRTVHILRP